MTDLGKKHAESIGRKLSVELKGQAHKIYSSDLIRAKQTVEPLARYLDLPVEYRAELREINFGVAIGKTKQWMRENSAPVNSIYDRSFPDAESGCDVYNRLSVFCDELINNDYENVIIASHSYSLSIWFGIWLKWDVNMFDNYGFDVSGKNAGGVSFMREDSDGKRIISRLNDMSYIY